MKFPPVNPTVLITGCSSGIGAAAAVQLRARGWTVYPTARKAEDLAGLRARGFDPVALDVADSASVQQAAGEVLARCGGALGAMVNNAGFGQAGALEDLSREALRYQFEVNVLGMQELTNRCIPAFRKQGRGRIVNISSVVGRISLPFLGAYSASKFAMEALSDALRIELAGSGIAVSLIEPGPIITDFRKTSVAKTKENINESDSVFGGMYQRELERRRDRQKQVGFINKAPEAVGEKIIHALESARPHRRYCVTLPAYAGMLIRRFAPYALTDALLSRKVRKRMVSAETPRAG